MCDEQIVFSVLPPRYAFHLITPLALGFKSNFVAKTENFILLWLHFKIPSNAFQHYCCKFHSICYIGEPRTISAFVLRQFSIYCCDIFRMLLKLRTQRTQKRQQLFKEPNSVVFRVFCLIFCEPSYFTGIRKLQTCTKQAIYMKVTISNKWFSFITYCFLTLQKASHFQRSHQAYMNTSSRTRDIIFRFRFAGAKISGFFLKFTCRRRSK